MEFQFAMESEMHFLSKLVNIFIYICSLHPGCANATQSLIAIQTSKGLIEEIETFDFDLIEKGATLSLIIQYIITMSPSRDPTVGDRLIVQAMFNAHLQDEGRSETVVVISDTIEAIGQVSCSVYFFICVCLFVCLFCAVGIKCVLVVFRNLAVLLLEVQCLVLLPVLLVVLLLVLLSYSLLGVAGTAKSVAQMHLGLAKLSTLKTSVSFIAFLSQHGCRSR